MAIIGSRYVCWTGEPRIKRPVQDFPKSPGANRGFLVSAIWLSHQNSLPFRLTSPSEGTMRRSAHSKRSAKCGNTITEEFSSQSEIRQPRI
jgi:hypothetical protein